jgi:hypothetical protein
LFFSLYLLVAETNLQVGGGLFQKWRQTISPASKFPAIKMLSQGEHYQLISKMANDYLSRKLISIYHEERVS